MVYRLGYRIDKTILAATISGEYHVVPLLMLYRFERGYCELSTEKPYVSNARLETQIGQAWVSVGPPT
jgi:hypothetical protein